MPETHNNWVRLQTLIILRWTAVLGQLTAIFGATLVFGIDLDLPLCLATVGAAVAANLVAIFLFPENKRLTQAETAATLLFDTAQLALLLALTGGLNNPFAVLILAPATIAATALERKATLLLVLATIGMITLAAIFHTDLVLRDGTRIDIPDIYLFGYWLAIVIGVAFLSVYTHRITDEAHAMSKALVATQLALAREQKLTDLGGVVAAAAHELGTPLATIKLVSAELADELSDNPDLRDDALLIREQADRCRDILHSMGRAGKDDLHLRSAPLMAVLREAAEPHLERGKHIYFDAYPVEDAADRQPTIYRYPELIHALRNLIQNATDFAHSTVWVDAEWSDDLIRVRVTDDGKGYDPTIINRIGDPFLHPKTTAADRNQRPEYEGMGLGLFIAKTLLERTGARLQFMNGPESYAPAADMPRRSGAMIEVTWPLQRIQSAQNTALGENRLIRS